MAKTNSKVAKVSRKNALRFLPGKTVMAGPGTSLSADAVAERAYLIYLAEGCPDGRHLDHWLRAEAELSAS